MAMYNNVEVSFAKKLSREQKKSASSTATSNTTIIINDDPNLTPPPATTTTNFELFYKELSLILINKFKNITKCSIANDIDTSGLIMLKIEELATLISILTNIPIESINIVKRVEYDVDCLGKIKNIV
jgi:hypothetical protein